MENLFSDNNLNIVLSPHLDDAVISLGAFINTYKSNTQVITIFSGKPENNKIRIWDLVCGFKNSSQAISSRLLENDAALTYLGLIKNNIINFDFLDYQYVTKKEREQSKENMNKILANKLLNILSINKERYINFFAPITKIHKDHEFVHDFLIYFKEICVNENIKLRFFFYEDYPYFLKFKKSKDYLKYLNYEKIQISLNKEDLKFKINTIKLYKSQFKFLLIDLTKFLHKIEKGKEDIFNQEVIYKLI